MKHQFGGIWTRKKLTVLEAYLRFYVTALKNQPFKLHYADAFAGTGSHSPARLENQDMLIPYEDFKGSVEVALSVDPAFHQYHFNDLNPAHIAELEVIRDRHPYKEIEIYQQDANAFVPTFCSSLSGHDRAILFVDPYSTQLDWSTLEHVAITEKVDLWLLFPISVILRMMPRDGDRIRPEWRETLNRLLGTDKWEEALYKPVDLPMIGDLFGDGDPTPVAERTNVDELQKWVSARLGELFPYVAKPVLLKNKGRPLFLFFFAVSNPEPKAWGLAEKAVSHIIEKDVGGDVP
ncbi:three-Cys-motif partner protein TcmP [Alloalcanivorax xenomutans]|uniref:three-Cys-motif partner protein TcmP n=1 Tax=Alloalcanivorax xenomutans TaxID=1094342 RepID=UPI002934E4BB|nr:three-Cys-motif partner protein TcmP [Alloalcanivorax xenomutans]WOD27083.1 three-Cys-motif partner protein TcmP [Alloalcanivorax xenomutans]